MRATHRCCTGLQIQLSGEPPGFMHAIRGTVIRQTLHRCARQLIAEALFYRPQHDILHDRAVVAPRACSPVYGLAVAAVQRIRYTQFFTIIAAELKAILTPAHIAFRNCDFTFIVHASATLVYHAVITGYARSRSCKGVWH